MDIHHRSLKDWLVDELRSPLYGESKTLAEHWITTEQILPLLDGLDEVAVHDRHACAEAINTFRNEHGLLQMVVCSRLAEYRSLPEPLQFPSAVVVQPLKRLEVEEYLNSNEPLDWFRTATKGDTGLWELLDSPLMISVAIEAYQKTSEIQPLVAASMERLRQQLFAKYVEAMFLRRGIKKRFQRKQTTRWLSSLASMLAKNNQPIFYLESLDFQWLEARAERLLARVGLVVLSGLVGILVGGVIGGQTVGIHGRLWDGLESGLFGGLIGAALKLRPAEYVHWANTSSQRSDALRDGLTVLRVAGLIGLIGGLFIGLYVSIDVLRGRERLGGMVGRLSDVLGDGLIANLISGFVGGLFFGLTVGLILGFLGGMFVTLSRLFTSEAMPETRSLANEGTYRSVLIALEAGLMFCVIAMLIGGLMALPALINLGLISGLIGGLLCGGSFVLKHLVLRLFLWAKGSAPLQYVAFLEQAKQMLFLRQVGGGYQFLHPMLLEYFVSLEEATKSPLDK